MNLSITSRLTLTTLLLTLAFFVPTGMALYWTVGSGIRAESIRSTEMAARYLALHAIRQWDEDLMVEYKDGEDPFRALMLNASDWALARGDGHIVEARGDLLSQGFALGLPGTSQLLDGGSRSYRIASVPLFGAPQETLENLPPAVSEAVRRASPKGDYLFSKREARRGTTKIEVSMLEAEHILELEVTYDGQVLDSDTDEFDLEVPADLAALIAAELGLRDIAFSSWKAYRGQLIAIVKGKDGSGTVKSLAVNRLGERFLLDGQGEILRVDPRSQLWIVTATDASDEVSARRSVLATIALGLTLLWSAVVLVGWYVTRRAMSPVNRIVEKVQRIELSRIGERLPLGVVEDELHRISATINTMLDRIQEGYTRERQFTGDASHELRGPIAKIMADIDVALLRERDASEYREILLRCRSYASGMQRLVDSLLLLARLAAAPEAPNARPFELTDLAAQTVRLLPEEHASRVKLDLPGEKTVAMAYGAPELVSVMLQNLLQNALRYSPPGSPVTLRLAPENGCVKIEVEDRGDGIPEDLLSRVFSRFFRVDKSRSRDTGGFGLGLAIVSEIARAHGTSIALANMPAGGLRASFSLPAR